MIDVLKPLAAAFALIVLEAEAVAVRDIKEDRERYKGEERHEELTDRLE